MRSSTRITLGAIAATAAFALAGCSSGSSGSGGSSDAGASDATAAVMYTSNNETTVGVVSDAASALDPALKVDTVTGSSGPLLQRIESEKSQPAADVFYSAPANTYADFVDVIEPYASPELDAVPAELVDPESRWTPTNTHVVAFMVNVDQVPGGKKPTSWADLASPAFAGKVIVADPTQSTTAFTALYGASKVLGDEGFQKLRDNLEVTESSSNVYPAVAQGEYAVSIGYESNIYPYVAGGQAGIEMVYPSDGTFVEYDYAFVVAGGPNPEGGKRLIDTILAKETQEQNLEQSFRRPVRTDIDPTEFVDFKKLDDLKIVDVRGDADAEGREAFLAAWSAAQ